MGGNRGRGLSDPGGSGLFHKVLKSPTFQGRRREGRITEEKSNLRK